MHWNTPPENEYWSIEIEDQSVDENIAYYEHLKKNSPEDSQLIILELELYFLNNVTQENITRTLPLIFSFMEEKDIQELDVTRPELIVLISVTKKSLKAHIAKLRLSNTISEQYSNANVTAENAMGIIDAHGEELQGVLDEKDNTVN